MLNWKGSPIPAGGRVINMEAVSLDPKAIIVKSDNENDILDIIDFISKKDKKTALMRC
jgi:hypothetical protein